jgi:hypothetical protein
MPIRSLSCAALLLALVAGLAISADNQGRDAVEVKRQKNVIEAEPKPRFATRTDLPKAAQSAERSARVLFITAEGCSRCERELGRLRASGGDFEVMRSRGWKIGDTADNHVQIVDRDSIPELVELLKVREYPTVACVVNGEIVRSFKDGCTTPLDAWTFGWLLKGENERPKSSIPEPARVATTGNYPLRGNHWSVEADPNPAKETVTRHLRGANHGHLLASYGAIENWSYEELRSLHDDLHEREGGGVYATYGAAQPPAANRSLDAFSGNRKATGR